MNEIKNQILNIILILKYKKIPKFIRYNIIRYNYSINKLYKVGALNIILPSKNLLDILIRHNDLDSIKKLHINNLIDNNNISLAIIMGDINIIKYLINNYQGDFIDYYTVSLISESLYGLEILKYLYPRFKDSLNSPYNGINIIYGDNINIIKYYFKMHPRLINDDKIIFIIDRCANREVKSFFDSESKKN